MSQQETSWKRDFGSDALMTASMHEFHSFVNLAKELTGWPDLHEDWLKEVWEGAGGALNIAMNRVLDGEQRRQQPAVQVHPAAPSAPQPPSATASSVDAMIEIDPGRLFWTSLAGAPATSEDTFYFSVDEELVYEPLREDFGPLDLSQTYRYCKLLENHLSNPELSSKRIVHYTSTEPKQRHNAAVLMCLFQVIVQEKSAEDACRHFQCISPPLQQFIDVHGLSNYRMTALDVARGLEKAIQLRWFEYDTFDCETYDHLSKSIGWMTWIVPGKLLAFQGPESPKVEDDVFSPDEYIEYFQKAGITMVIRLNERMYDMSQFTSHGIKHIDLYFDDGESPPEDVVQRFLDITSKEPGPIAIHCRSGLGRTGTVIGLWCMKHAGWDARAFIGWIRVCRPGSIHGPQQEFLCDIQRRLQPNVAAEATAQIPKAKTAKVQTRPAFPLDATGGAKAVAEYSVVVVAVAVFVTGLQHAMQFMI